MHPLVVVIRLENRDAFGVARSLELVDRPRVDAEPARFVHKWMIASYGCSDASIICADSHRPARTGSEPYGVGEEGGKAGGE